MKRDSRGPRQSSYDAALGEASDVSSTKTDPPLAPSSPGDPPVASAPRAGSRRVLLVDDHEDTTELFRMMLRKQGYEVVVAASVAAALAAAEQSELDVVVSDIHLPDGKGYDLLRRLRATSGLVAIALSGGGLDDADRRSDDERFDEYFSKPAKVRDVIEAIRRRLAERGR